MDLDLKRIRNEMKKRDGGPTYSEANLLLNEIERLRAEAKSFPIIHDEKSKPALMKIPWSVAEKAYSVYSSRYGESQSLERLAERGGFYAGEMDVMYPGWRDETSEIQRLRAELAEEGKLIQGMRDDLFKAYARIAELGKVSLKTIADLTVTEERLESSRKECERLQAELVRANQWLQDDGVRITKLEKVREVARDIYKWLQDSDDKERMRDALAALQGEG